MELGTLMKDTLLLLLLGFIFHLLCFLFFFPCVVFFQHPHHFLKKTTTKNLCGRTHSQTVL